MHYLGKFRVAVKVHLSYWSLDLAAKITLAVLPMILSKVCSSRQSTMAGTHCHNLCILRNVMRYHADNCNVDVRCPKQLHRATAKNAFALPTCFPCRPRLLSQMTNIPILDLYAFPWPTFSHTVPSQAPPFPNPSHWRRSPISFLYEVPILVP